MAGEMVERAPTAHLERNSLGLKEIVLSGLVQVAPASSLMLTTALMAGLAGASVPLVMLIAMVGVAATGNALAQFSRIWPSSGSFVTFISRAIGPRAGLAVAVVALLGYIVAFAGIYLFAGQYIATEILHVHAAGAAKLIALGYGLVLLVPVIVGLQVGMRIAIAMYVFEFAVIAAVSIAILVQGGDHGLSSAPFSFRGSGLHGVASALALAVLAFVGFEAPAPLAEESENPRRNVPVAIIAGILISGLIFVVGSYAAVEAFPSAAKYAADAAPFTTAAARFIAPLAHVVTLLFVLSMSSSFIMANTETSRVIFNGAREGLWHPVIARVHERFRTPWVATLAFVLPSLAIAMLGTLAWDLETASGFLSTLGTLGVVVMYATTNLALIVLWFRERAAGRTRHVLLWLATPLVGIAVMVLLFWSNFQGGQPSPYSELPIGLGALVAIGLLYTAFLQLRRPQLARNAGSLVMGERVVAGSDPVEVELPLIDGLVPSAER